VKQYIVQALACFDKPSQIAEAVKDEFNIVVPRQQVEKYDPTKQAGRGLSKKWRVVFNDARDAWRKGTTEVPIANRVFRLRTLDRLAAKAEKARNAGLTMRILEQAAKEVGDVYVNRGRGPGGPDGQGEEPVPTQVIRGVKSARKDDDG